MRAILDAAIRNDFYTFAQKAFPIVSPEGELRSNWHVEAMTYVQSPLRPGRFVLVVDDFCTQGNSFEAARAYVERTGARAICLGWLKTINTDYLKIADPPGIVDPYAANHFAKSPKQVGIRIIPPYEIVAQCRTSRKSSNPLINGNGRVPRQPISMQITAIAVLSFSDMACFLSLAPLTDESRNQAR